MSKAIRAQALTKSFGNLKAVDSFSVEVDRGEIFGLVGPDGAGKTTVIRLLSTILLPSGGDALVGGYSVTDEPHDVRRLIGYMSQRFTLYADLTVLENLLFFADIYQIPKGERGDLLAELLEFSRLTEFTNRPAGQLSGGMKQKLALACTLIHEPKILLLDEPTTGVDPVSRRDFWRILAELHQREVTIFVATPYMDEAERCQRVAFMRDGRLTVCDTPGNIKARVPGQVVAVTSPAPHAAAEALRGLKVAQRVEMYGESLQVTVEDPDEAIPAIRAKLNDEGVVVESMSLVDLTMENAFAYLAVEDV